MIHCAYSHKRLANSHEIIFSFLVFLTLTFFFFYTFLNICFETIVTDPPIALMVVAFSIMGIDLAIDIYLSRTLLTARIIMNSVIMIFLILSWLINNQIVFYFSALVFLRFPEVVYFSDIMKDKLRGKYPVLFKLYVVLKIVYMIAVFGHVTGCIFYVIDQTLLKQEIFGSLENNPTMYYQGAVLCYTPIQSLEEIYRYAYAMYYIVSLLSTVAYGDIIPHNPVENAYVLFLLVFSTVSIGFIIEQMVIVFRNEQNMLYFLLRKMKYFNFKIVDSQINSKKRRELNRFIIYHFYKRLIFEPKVSQLPSQLKKKLLLNPLQTNRIPNLIVQNLIDSISIKFYCCDSFLLNNFCMEQRYNAPSTLRIFSHGKLSVGYGDRMFAQEQISQPGFLVGWAELLYGTKTIHPYLKIRTIDPSIFYEIKKESLFFIAKNKDRNMNKNKEKDHNNNNNNKDMNQQDTRVEVEKNTDFLEKIFMEREKQLNSYSTFKCWVCQKNGHFPKACPLSHFSPTFNSIPQSMPRNINVIRSQTKSTKILQLTNSHSQEQFSVSSLIEKKQFQLRNLEKQIYLVRNKSVDEYEEYRYFHPSFNLIGNTMTQERNIFRNSTMI